MECGQYLFIAYGAVIVIVFSVAAAAAAAAIAELLVDALNVRIPAPIATNRVD
ncbi:MAG: hypothetical protein K0R28_825 [Paenibacillus sp.]|nr:hypothetical protein [Paenibacillus sp.]